MVRELGCCVIANCFRSCSVCFVGETRETTGVGRKQGEGEVVCTGSAIAFGEREVFERACEWERVVLCCVESH